MPFDSKNMILENSKKARVYCETLEHARRVMATGDFKIIGNFKTQDPELRPKTCNVMYYGNRLKATVTHLPRYRAYSVILYTYKKQVYASKLFFNENISEKTLYKKAHDYADNYLKTCKY